MSTRTWSVVAGYLLTLVAAQIDTSTYTAPNAFPTSLYGKYYNNPTATSAQVQPVVTDPITVESFNRFKYRLLTHLSHQHKVYPLKLTDPGSVPVNNTVDHHPLPPVASSERLVAQAIIQIQSVANNPIFGTNTCARCQAGLEIAKFLALAAPKEGPGLAVKLCEIFKFSSTCDITYGRFGSGAVLTQVIANADVGGLDGQVGQTVPSNARYMVDLIYLSYCVRTFSTYVPYPRRRR